MGNNQNKPAKETKVRVVRDYKRDKHIVNHTPRVTILKAHTTRVNCLLQVSDSTLVTGSRRTLKRWTLYGNLLSKFVGHYAAVRNVFEVDQNTMVSGAFDGCIMVWDVATATCILSVQAHTVPIQSLTPLRLQHYGADPHNRPLPPPRLLLLSTVEDPLRRNEYKAWRLDYNNNNEGQPRIRCSPVEVKAQTTGDNFLTEAPSKVLQLRSEQTLVICTGTGMIRTHPIRMSYIGYILGVATTTYESIGQVSCMIELPTNGYLALALQDHSILIWSTAAQRSITFDGHNGRVTTMTLSGTNLVSSSPKDRRICVWDVAFLDNDAENFDTSRCLLDSFLTTSSILKMIELKDACIATCGNNSSGEVIEIRDTKNRIYQTTLVLLCCEVIRNYMVPIETTKQELKSVLPNELIELL
eukprot:TRINITY_DN16528_c0_g1_i1.p1 TRINITY_DN16528_c0_g1~~TRINITY_DN16528_c0_g1_i1.p1  ORF type:complete len:413 (+),score=37.74 TRINITY_DN16528_c0_g1_i1:94-1332(+)